MLTEILHHPQWNDFCWAVAGTILGLFFEEQKSRSGYLRTVILGMGTGMIAGQIAQSLDWRPGKRAAAVAFAAFAAEPLLSFVRRAAGDPINMVGGFLRKK